MRKIKILTTLVCALVLSAVCLSGCDQVNEQVLQNSITKELDSIKNLDEYAVETMAAELDDSDFSGYGVTKEDYLRAYYEGFDYSIDDITVNGNKAQATVTLICKSRSDFDSKLDVAQNQLYQSVSTESTPEEIKLAIGNMIMETLHSTELAPTDPIIIDLSLSDNTWTPTSDVASLVSQAIAGN